jgi:hypothetical protein
MPRFTTRHVPADHMIALKPFTTSGAMDGIAGARGAGALHGHARRVFDADRSGIKYSVYSYATPIAWVRADGQWVVVDDRFSVTTGKHQSNLYGLPDPVRVGFDWGRVTAAQGRLLATLAKLGPSRFTGSDKRPADTLAARGYAIALASGVYTIHPAYAERCR